jgi:DMSO/TMAO reductase YedYZ molybdopterin-dependent catalytic subunit
MTDELRGEEDFLAARAEQLAARLEGEGVSRRRLFQLAGNALPLLAGGKPLTAAASADRQLSPGLPIQKPLPPEWFVRFGTNAETQWDSLADVGHEVPNERFFVRNHTATPLIDPATWRLRVFGDGLKLRPGAGDAVEFSLRDLERLPSKRLTALIECAGNGRSFFASQQGVPASGTQWALGAVGVAEWRGVPLSEVLERAGITKSAVDVLPEGLDANVVAGGLDLGRVRRPLPVEKALDDVLLAYEMNGVPLPADHGFPVRLVVPGWVGIASIKWLGRIEVSAEPLFSPWNTTSYRMFGPDYPADSPPLTSVPSKSALEVARDAVLPLGQRTTLTGRAWSGAAAIRRVEVSTDMGATWADAMLQGESRPGTWARWSFAFEARLPGRHEIWTRATDENDRAQPSAVPFNTYGYLYSAVVRHPVVVA